MSQLQVKIKEVIPPEGNVLGSVEEKPHGSKTKRVMSRGKRINVKYKQKA